MKRTESHQLKLHQKNVVSEENPDLDRSVFNNNGFHRYKSLYTQIKSAFTTESLLTRTAHTTVPAKTHCIQIPVFELGLAVANR